jgi:hypothetical protein
VRGRGALAFVIADTRVDQLDPTELQALAAELEKVLFPAARSARSPR